MLLRLAFQGTSFRLSDTRTQGRGTPKEVRTTLLPLSRVLLFLLLLSPPQLYLALRLTQGQRSVPTRCVRPRCPCWVHPSNIFAGGRGGLGDQGTPNLRAQPLAGTEIRAGAARGAKPWSQHQGLWVRPALRPLNGRLCSSPGAAKRAAGAATMGRPPLLRPAPKLRAAPSPALRRLAA